ncbi:MAG: flagellar hook-length control protein FliK [Huintestinicola sp.]
MGDVMASVTAAAMLRTAVQAGGSQTEAIGTNEEASFSNVLKNAFASDTSAEITQETDIAAAPEMTDTAPEAPEVTDVVITEDGKNAFLSTLVQYIAADKGQSVSADISSLLKSDIWKDVGTEEIKAFGQLADALASGEDIPPETAAIFKDIFSDEDEEMSLKDVLDSLIKLPVSSGKKDDKDNASDSTDDTDSDLFLMLAYANQMNPCFRDMVSRVTVPEAETEISIQAVDAGYTADAVPDTEGMTAEMLTEADISASDDPTADITAGTDENTLREFCCEFAEAVRNEYPEETDAADYTDHTGAATQLHEEGIVTADDETAEFPEAKAAAGTDAPEIRYAPVTDKAGIAADNVIVADKGPDGFSMDFVSRMSKRISVPQMDEGELSFSEIGGFSVAQALAPEAPSQEVMENDAPMGEIPRYYEADEQIIEKIRMSHVFDDSANGTKEITMKLDPEELGRLDIRITRTDKGVDISFAAESSEAAKLIADKSAVLADALASRGVKLREMVVTDQIVTSESKGTDLEFRNDGHQNPYPETGSGQGHSRHFTFSDSGSLVSDIREAADDETESKAIYHKEAKLWATA